MPSTNSDRAEQGGGDVHVMVRMEPAMKSALQADAKVNERTVSQTVRLAIRRYIEVHR